ncbi:MAG TPA: VWA domain-containing protein [Acidobacteriota bacterium]|nr:VWA domain-containing protein [Acidobacteriota bacterium]
MSISKLSLAYKLAFLFFIVFLFRGSLGSQEYEVSVTTINVWVKVVDRSGKPVQGLMKNDFVVSEDDHSMPLTCFEEIKGGVETDVASGTAPAQTQPSTPTASRKLVLFLDLFNTSPNEYNKIRPQMQDFLNQIKGKNWEVMIATLTPTGKMGIVAPFTRDIDAISRTLDKAPTNPTRDQRITSAKLSITNTLEQSLRGANQVDDRVFDDVVRAAYSTAQQYAREERDIAEYTLSALQAFGAELGKRKGDDHAVLLFISGGFTGDPGRQYFDLITNFVEWAGAASNPMELNFRFPDSQRKFNFDLRKEIRDSIGRLNRNNITLYGMNTRGTVNPGAMATTSMNSVLSKEDFTVLQDYQDSLIEIAKETGGFSFQNSTNFKLGFNNVLDDLNHYYVVCFNAPEHKKKGEYHRIKVEVKKPDTKIRYRQGYVD